MHYRLRLLEREDIPHPARRGRIESHLFDVLRVSIRKPKAVQTVKLTLVIGTVPKHRNPTSVDMQDLIHRMNQTAHISLQIPSISKSVETKSTRSATLTLAQPASLTSVCYPLAFPQKLRSLSPSRVPPAPQRRR